MSDNQCVRCGVGFVPETPHQRFCSQECKDAPKHTLTSEEARELAKKRKPVFSQEQIQTALMALVAWAGNAAAASRYLESEKGISITPSTLSNWKRTHSIEFDELREKYSAQMEASLAHEFRDVAMQAVQLERLAMEKAVEALEKNQDKNPSRSAANAARVAQSSTDKLLSLTGRPTSITETRNVDEILRSLAAKGVIQIPQEAGGDG